MLGGKCKILAVREKRPILPTQPNHQAAMNYRVGSQSLYGQMLNILICGRHSSSFEASSYAELSYRALIEWW